MEVRRFFGDGLRDGARPFLGDGLRERRRERERDLDLRSLRSLMSVSPRRGESERRGESGRLFLRSLTAADQPKSSLRLREGRPYDGARS